MITFEGKREREKVTREREREIRVVIEQTSLVMNNELPSKPKCSHLFFILLPKEFSTGVASLSLLFLFIVCYRYRLLPLPPLSLSLFQRDSFPPIAFSLPSLSFPSLSLPFLFPGRLCDLFLRLLMNGSKNVLFLSFFCHSCYQHNGSAPTSMATFRV